MTRRAHPSSGLYDPAYEHDACGLAFVVDLAGEPSHRVVEQGLAALRRLDHRGARGADQDTGDGAGITLQLPDVFFRTVTQFELPAAGQYATGLAFLPTAEPDRTAVVDLLEAIATSEGMRVTGWRKVPTNPAGLGTDARDAAPAIAQVFLTPDGRRGA
ncbi:MAG: glutamate synthase subunit alpha, partial [Pseudonocardiaceae bacterium]